MVRKIWNDLSLKINSIHQAQSDFYFEIGNLTKSIAKDMENTTANLSYEIKADFELNAVWNYIVDRILAPRHMLNITDQEKVVFAYTTAFSYNYNRALREWYKKVDNTFKFYWFTKLVLENVQFNASTIECYRGIHPANVSEGIYKKQAIYNKGDSIYSNQFESCSMKKDVAEKFATENYNDTSIFRGSVVTIRMNYFINAFKETIHPEEVELIIPPGYQFKVTKAVKSNKVDEFDYFDIDLINK